MKKLAHIAAISVLVTGLSSAHAQAATFTEKSDAGKTLNTAQVIPSGSQLLEFITGTLSNNDADLFQIFLTGGQTFSATTLSLDTLVGLPVDNVLGAPTELLEDPQLFLFDASGKGIYGNDDIPGLNSQSVLSSGGFSPAQSGIYYLAIASSGYDPVSAVGKIFSAGADGVLEPTGSGGNLSLSGFTGTSATSGRYGIALTGVTTSTQSSAESIPEPAGTWGILALGALGAVSQLKNNRKKQKFTS
ncbi:DVUA0089 family protein [Coleofasciculus sp. H7-2]|uniref:DVUA0089 family protein n=1 Tax=Coleofasciculus sp. H7-2 TaxID=3351545 RepID=UPI0036720F38